MDNTVCNTRSQIKTIFPRAKFDGINRCLSFIFENTLPLIIGDFFPKLDKLIISTSGYNTFIFRMSPSDPPAWTLMCGVRSNILINQESRALWDDLIILQSANLHNSITITCGKSGAIEIKLAIILQLYEFQVILYYYLLSYPCVLYHGSVLIHLAIC